MHGLWGGGCAVKFPLSLSNPSTVVVGTSEGFLPSALADPSPLPRFESHHEKGHTAHSTQTHPTTSKTHIPIFRKSNGRPRLLKATRMESEPWFFSQLLNIRIIFSKNIRGQLGSPVKQRKTMNGLKPQQQGSFLRDSKETGVS